MLTHFKFRRAILNFPLPIPLTGLYCAGIGPIRMFNLEEVDLAVGIALLNSLGADIFAFRLYRAPYCITISIVHCRIISPPPGC